MNCNYSLPPGKALEPAPLQERQHTQTFEEAFSAVALKPASINTTPSGRGTADATIVPGTNRDHCRRQRTGGGPAQPHGGHNRARPGSAHGAPRPRQAPSGRRPQLPPPPRWRERAGSRPRSPAGGSGRGRPPRAPSPRAQRKGSCRPRRRAAPRPQPGPTLWGPAAGGERPPPPRGTPREGSGGTRGRHRSRSPETYCGPAPPPIELEGCGEDAR